MNEKYLIAGLKNRNKEVFDYVFNYYYSGLCTYSLKYIQNKAIVEDIVQDFFVSLWIKKDRISINTSLKSYLFTSIKNSCLNYLKHNKIQEKFNLQVLYAPENLEEDNFNLFVESELREAFDNALKKLSPRCREIFELSRLKGLKNQEIAEKLDISKRTVESQISDALKIMRVELKEFLPAWVLFFLLR